MGMEIFLIRHGECKEKSEDNYSSELKMYNPGLTMRGEEQARNLANILFETTFNVIYSSDLARAMKTADIIAERCPANRVVAKELREIDMGYLEKQSWSDFPDIYARWKLHEEDLAFPGGECGRDVWSRVRHFLMQAVAEHHERVAVVTHGGVIRSAVCGVLGVPQQKRFLIGTPIENCSITKIVYDKDSFYINTVNERFML